MTGPDGIALDTEGNIWASGNGEMALYQINPKYVSVFIPHFIQNDQYFKTLPLFIRSTGELMQNISLPARFAQSMAFGGPNLDQIYVGTSSMAYTIRTGDILFDAVIPEEEGYLYRITDLGPGVRGRPVQKVSLRYASCAIESGQYIVPSATVASPPATNPTTATTTTVSPKQESDAEGKVRKVIKKIKDVANFVKDFWNH